MNRAFGTGFNRNNINSNNEKNYELRPKFNAKFTKEKVYGIIKAILDEKMEYFQGEYDHDKAIELNEQIVSDVKDQLNSGKLNINRYKIIVHYIIAQKQ